MRKNVNTSGVLSLLLRNFLVNNFFPVHGGLLLSVCLLWERLEVEKL